MTIWKYKLPHAMRWLGRDEWNYFVLPEVLFVLVIFAYAVAVR